MNVGRTRRKAQRDSKKEIQRVCRDIRMMGLTIGVVANARNEEACRTSAAGWARQLPAIEACARAVSGFVTFERMILWPDVPTWSA